MNEVDTRCLDLFPKWLESLGRDVQLTSEAVEDEVTPAEARAWLLGALNYLFKSLDLIPDGIEDLGFIDDAFVLRMCISRAVRDGLAGSERLADLADEVSVIEQFLDADFPRLEAFVGALPEAAVHGNTVADLIADDDACRQLLMAVAGFARQYQAPGFAPEEKNLIKLRSFMSTKLPAAD